MTDDLHHLIDRLEYWQTDGDIGGDSSRALAIAELRRRAEEAVPALIERLHTLLSATIGRRERVAAVGKAWQDWYEESDRLREEHGPGDVERFRTVPTASLPQPDPADDRYIDPVDLKQGIIRALDEIGDQRAAPVLVAALADRSCIAAAAEALQHVRSDRAVPAMLDAAAMMWPSDDRTLRTLVAALEDYDTPATAVHERFTGATSPQERVAFYRVLTSMTGTPPPAEDIRDALTIQALDRDGAVHRSAREELDRIDGRPGRHNAMDDDPATDIVRSAIVMAAHGAPPGHDRELLRRVRLLTGKACYTRAVEDILCAEPAAPEQQELTLALQLARGSHLSTAADPPRFAAALSRLSSHPRFGDLARTTLLRGGFLFGELVHDDAERRAAARIVFDRIASADDHAHFARYAAAVRGGAERRPDGSTGRVRPWSRFLDRIRGR